MSCPACWAATSPSSKDRIFVIAAAFARVMTSESRLVEPSFCPRHRTYFHKLVTLARERLSGAAKDGTS